MSKSSELDKAVKAYILECIDATGHDIKAPKTDAEKVQFLKDTFYSEYDYMIARAGEITALKKWLPGLPSSCSVEYRNFEIMKLAVLWGSVPEDYTEKQEEKIINNWFNLLANKTAQLFRKHCK